MTPFMFRAIRRKLKHIRYAVLERLEAEKSNVFESWYGNTDMKSVRMF